MSLLTQASLVLTPTAYKANKLYSIIPSSGNGDMVTTRATTATRVNSSGLVENVATGIPRLDYTGSVPSILLEPQRTNLILNSVWVGGGSLPTSWLFGLPTGTSIATSSIKNTNVTAYRFVTNTQRQEFYQNTILALNSINTLSVYVESVTTAIPVSQLLRFSATTGTGTSIYLKNNVPILSSENITVGNAYSLQFTCTLADTFQARVGCGVIGNVTGDITLSMPQLELGSYATSYIPTTTSTVTRNLDDITKTGISTDILNPSEGTFYVEISALSNDLTLRKISLSDGTDFNQIAIQFSSVSNIIRLDTYGQTGVGTFANYRSSVTVANTTTLHKCLIKWSGSGGTSGISMYVDGTKYTPLLAAGTGTGIPTALNRIDFKQYYGANYFYGKCKGMQIYKTALTDAECASLTTL